MNDMNSLQLSLFRGVHDTQPRPVTLMELVTMMSTDQSVRDLTDKHRYARATGDEQGAKRYKHMMASFGVAARFEGGRQQKHIVEYTGLSLVDIDHIPVERMSEVLALVRGDEHTLLAYTTLSGQGLRVLFRYVFNDDDNENENCYPLRTSCSSPLKRDSAESTENKTNQKELSPFKGDERSVMKWSEAEGVKLRAEQYKQAFAEGNKYYSQLTGLATDGQCKNIGRISTIAYDENLYYNPDAVPFVVTIEEKKSVGRPKRSRKATDVEGEVLAKVEAKGIRYEPHHHNDYIARACYEMNRQGVAEADCTAWALERFADYAETDNVPAIVRSCYQQTDEHGTTKPKAERKYATVDDIEEFLKQRIQLRYNTIARIVEVSQLPSIEGRGEMSLGCYDERFISPKECCKATYGGGSLFVPFQDKDLNSLWREMSKTCGMRVIKDDMCSVIRSDFAQQYNPFEEYIRSLPAWDGVTDYIGRLASSVTVASDADEWREVLRKWFVGFIAGLFMPDEVNHGILVFIGEQGKYKSTWFYYLLPEELRRYFLIKLMDGYITKDDLFNIAQSALVCLEEIDNMKQKELNQLKALTTMRTISARPAYGRFNEHLPHIASFCATGNNPFFLTDDSTNRRFLTFEVIGIEPPQEYDFQYEGLYAQAYALWKQGFRYWFNEEDNRATSRRNRDFEAPSRERELISKYYRAPMEGEQCKFLTASDILERIGALMHGLNVVKVGMAMTALGHKRLRLGDKRGYRLVELTMTDIENRQKMLGDTATNNEEALHTEYTTTTDVQQELPF